ncbi:MAG TPA: protein kinase family protein [Candidatus Xenobia bacterium]
MTTLDRFGDIPTAAPGAVLQALDDKALARLVHDAPTLRRGIGGSGAVLEVAGSLVYVKRLPLTDIEYEQRSTANLFDLPPCCHYGVGSPGYNAWRELDAHAMTSVAPVLYHWRVLDLPPGVDLADADATPYGADAPRVQARIDAVAQASHSLILFMEHVPFTLLEWLDQVQLDTAIDLVENHLQRTVSEMNQAGVWHFDAHFGNVLTDGRRLLFTDFALAASSKFDMQDDEREFIERHRRHDSLHVQAQWINWLVSSLARPADRNTFIEACAAGAAPEGLPDAAAALVRRHAGAVADFNRFYRKVFLEDRRAPWPW